MRHAASGLLGRARFVLALFLGLAWFAPLSAQVHVPAGASLDLAGGRIDFGGRALSVEGELALGAGRLDGLDDFRVLAGGSADLGSGIVRLAGDWENRGALIAGTSLVDFIDGVGDSFVLGATEFANLRVATALGKRIRLESGRTQRVTGALTLTGTGVPLRIDSTLPPAVAYLDLLPGGTQSISNVAVWDVHAIGQRLAPTQTNQGGNANTSGWFGFGVVSDPAVIPTTSPLALTLLALLVIALALARRNTSNLLRRDER